MSFKLFGAINVTYHHGRGTADLYRQDPSGYFIVLTDGSNHHIENAYVGQELADKIRRVVFITSIDVYFD